ncbi:deoxyribodipyrimidine photo-lyase [Winogradskyella epiphytica]|uniref:Deoxyribodipyrimidine photo-lyase n=1 Tax=Winogradskyella epiphytica TaxID=262005 RepID=A0A2V4WUU8_9FLAO|nr:deoxyribodipyrimidine photo-lyase [Winogradskyella epiphytica]PYE80237.1 deoxyribodipyrimidine photo-lyase [Winogradskyella epiphytica]GGW69956.1 deoxyribodipyrimidine photo-lyase [Winogradskyella epiphytica]
MSKNINIFWFRRDLRLDDNHALYKALKAGLPVLPIFIFDTEILNDLQKDDARVTFIHEQLQQLRKSLEDDYGSSIGFYHGTPEAVFRQLISDYTIHSVFTNRDYEPYATQRDTRIKSLFDRHNIEFNTYKDHVIFEKDEVVKKDGSPYLVYTPYMKTWKSTFKAHDLTPFKSETHLDRLIQDKELPNLSLSAIGFQPSNQNISPYEVSSSLIQNYEATRNFPAADSTSRLGPHLRFGTVSIRKVVKKAISEANEIFWQELIWREFFIQILWHFPQTTNQSFKPQYDRIVWRNNEDEFQKWCDGHTGYPLVDAGMRQLNQTGFMHNRVRMLVGSFLCKHLLIDWRWGEAYFAEKLHDYEMASNVGNWQWVAGTGVDASPYFRIFNPTTQIQKFDKHHDYIKTWVPEYQESSYPQPMVDHKEARERCLKTYKSALQ